MSGGREVLAGHRPRLLLEVEQRHLERFGHQAESVVSWLAGYGYRMFGRQRGEWQEVDRVTEQRRNYLFSVDEPAGGRPAPRR